jgi:hypothetical protein
LAALLLGLGLWQYNRHNSQALYEEWVEPITGKVLPAPPTAKTEEVAAVVPEVIAAAPAALKTEAISAPVAAAVAPSAVAASTQSVVVAPSAKETTAKETAAKETAATKNPAAASTASAADCANITTAPVTVTSVSPNKPGSYVYLVANKTTTVCVDDGKNKRNLVTLTPGAGRSIHGSPPWTIAAADLKSVQVYFQGAKVWVPPEAGSRIYLKELPISP